MNGLKQVILAVQNFVLLAGRAFGNIFRGPHYVDDILLQMDIIGVGSFPIVVLTGMFSGVTLALQMSRALNEYGASSETGQIVSFSLVRELGPVLTALMVAGRNASGMASELGSMKVTEQIDAMRALGTDPIKKLVTPRLLATMATLPMLTVLSDFFGMFGGFLVAVPMLNLTTSTQYWTSSYQYLEYNDVVQGLMKPFIFAIIIATVGCHEGMQTSGGTQGVGRATTRAVVAASLWVFIANVFVTRFFVNLK